MAAEIDGNFQSQSDSFLVVVASTVLFFSCFILFIGLLSLDWPSLLIINGRYGVWKMRYAILSDKYGTGSLN
jgi:hypothetical protein